MRRKVLIGWELGEGFGHTMRLAEAARALSATGWRVHFAVRDPNALAMVERGFPVELTPPHSRVLTNPKEFRARSYADMLAAVGFGSVNTLLPVVCAWRRILETIKPDLVVSDYSPILCLAAFGQVPVLTIGDGFVLPPGVGDRYPRLRPGETGLPDEAAMLAVVIEVQATLGCPFPPSLPRMTQGDGQIVTVVEELDVYAQGRCNELRAPFGIPLAGGVPDNLSPSYFVYLTALAPTTEKVLQALLDGCASFETFLRDAGPKLRNAVRQRGGFVYDKLPPLESMLHRHHAIIHHGGIGTSQTALAMGRPQVLVPRHFEQTLTALRLKALSVGSVLREKHLMSDVREVLAHLPRSRLPAEASRRAQNIATRNYPDLPHVIVAEASRLVSG